MATKPASSSLLVLAAVVALLLLLSAGAGISSASSTIIDEACAATPYPDLCRTTLLASPDSKDAAATSPRALAEVAIRAASDAGAAAGGYARDQMLVVRDNDDNALWTCLDECADDIEEAVSHLDDTEGEIDDAARFEDVRLFLDTAERDSWSCDEGCKHVPPSPVKAALLAKNRDFEAIMNVTSALVKQATTGGGAAPAPAPTMPSAP